MNIDQVMLVLSSVMVMRNLFELNKELARSVRVCFIPFAWESQYSALWVPWFDFNLYFFFLELGWSTVLLKDFSVEINFLKTTVVKFMESAFKSDLYVLRRWSQLFGREVILRNNTKLKVQVFACKFGCVRVVCTKELFKYFINVAWISVASNETFIKN